MKEKTVEELEKDVEEHENKLSDIELEIEAEDAVIPRGFAKTFSPTIPYRSWCPICIQAKKKNIAHKKTKSDRGVPVFSIDYMFLNGKDSLADPALVMTESESGGVWALPVKRKGNYTSYISSRIANIIEKVGSARCVLKSDQEPAIMDVTKEVKRQLWEELQASARNVQTDTTKVEVENLVEPQLYSKIRQLVSHRRMVASRVSLTASSRRFVH